MYIFRGGGVAHSSAHDYLLFARQCWINIDDLTCIFAYKSMSMYSCLTDSRGQAVSASLTLSVFVKALAFAAAVKVTSDRWALLDLDQGVLNHSALLLLKSQRECVKEWGRV